MRIIAFLLFLLSTPALACQPFMPAVLEAQKSFSVLEETLQGDDVAAFLKANFNIEARADLILIMIDPSDGEILVAGALGPCIDGHMRKMTSSLSEARRVIREWMITFEKAKALKEDRGKS